MEMEIHNPSVQEEVAEVVVQEQQEDLHQIVLLPMRLEMVVMDRMFLLVLLLDVLVQQVQFQE